MFRLVIGCNDHCARNFIINDNKVYSIDDHCLDLDFDSIDMIKMKKDIRLKWDSYIIVHKVEILKILKKWNIKFRSENMINRINKLIDVIKR